MLSLTQENSVMNYLQGASPELRADMMEILDIMGIIAPEAKLVGDLGIPYFEQDSGWVYGVAAREDHLCVYFANAVSFSTFSDRLSHVQFGNDCLVIHRLEDININVLVELLGLVKVNFVIKQLRDKDISIH